MHVADFRRPVQHRDLVIIRQSAGMELPIDMTDALHPEVCELCGPQRSNTGSAIDVDALGHSPEDFLVPDRRHDFGFLCWVAGRVAIGRDTVWAGAVDCYFAGSVG